jgi:NAD(P)-dependent dehydrogenase (short-subunit alcohol dehydrogenase family)
MDNLAGRVAFVTGAASGIGLGIATALAESALRRRRWLEAEERIAALAPLYAQDSTVRRLQQDLRAWRGWELQLGFAQRLEDGSAAQAPAKNGAPA